MVRNCETYLKFDMDNIWMSWSYQWLVLLRSSTQFVIKCMSKHSSNDITEMDLCVTLLLYELRLEFIEKYFRGQWSTKTCENITCTLSLVQTYANPEASVSHIWHYSYLDHERTYTSQMIALRRMSVSFRQPTTYKISWNPSLSATF